MSANGDLSAELEQLISQIGQATKRIQGGERPENGSKLVATIKELEWALEGPEICLANLAQATVGQSVFRTALELGLFQKFGNDPISISELSRKCNAPEILLARLMRVLVSHGIFKLDSPEIYSHTILSMALQSPLVTSVAQGIAEQASTLTKLPDYLASTSYRDPPSGKESFFPYAMNTKLTKYEWLEEHPEKLKIFQDFQSAKDQMTGEKLKERLKEIIKKEAKLCQESNGAGNDADDTILFCDVGGGRGGILKDAISEAYEEDKQLHGRVVTEDLPNVVAGLEKTRYWEAIPHNFFDDQPVRGARIYQLRDCLHNWSDDSSRAILAKTVAAMSKQSRILITETVIPDTNPPLLLSNMDILMMQFGGRERTEKDWRELLKSAGLKLDEIEFPERGNRVGEVLLWVSLDS